MVKPMPKKAKEISAVQIPKLPEGLHAVGVVPGLYLRVAPSGARNWILRTMVGKRRRDMGLGGWPDVPLAEARDRARDARRKVQEGVDPIEQRKAARSTLIQTPTFAECVKYTIAAKRAEWKNAKHAAQWISTLETYANPIIGKMPVDQVDLPHIERILSPLWNTKTETATRLRARIEAVLDWATVSRHRTGDNPARWKGNLDVLLAKPNKVKKVEHHAALPVDSLHGFITDLRKRDGMAAMALEFLILTAARSGEVRGAVWDEIDLDAKLWTIPAERMKARKEHRVPLNTRALEILKSLPRIAGCKFVFPSPTGKQLSDMTISAVIRRMAVDAVPHGFRSTFRDWASERTAYPNDVAEMALAHTIPNKVEAAYRRGDLFAKRVNMMKDWQKFIDTPPAKGNVVTLRRDAK